MRTIALVLVLACCIPAVFAQKSHSKKKSESAQPQSESQKASPTAGTPTPIQGDDSKDRDPWKALQYRLIGPFRGGRVVAVTGVVGQPDTYYFGAVAGGVWKTTDGGLNWMPIFDKTKDASPAIGAIAVSESDPNVIYVGTGEACVRGNIVGGNGVYKSIDAGATWKFVGLADTHAIGRLIVNPKNPDIAFVAALGHPFADNEERGIFRTQDGGKTWEKVLYKDAKTGGIDLAFDPTNANIVYAALWQVRRTPWSLDSGGPGSGLYRSADGGTTWKQLKGHGLPETILGRIGVTVSGANPNRVWAVVEAEKGGIFRSDDSGETWHILTDDHRFRQRAWYYSHIFADPKSADTVYILNTSAYRSNDGGKTFANIRAPHGDNHALWIDPTNPKRMINGNDGGATISTDGGDSWSSQDNSADRAVLPRHHRQSLPLLHLRRAAGQLHRRHRQRERRTAPSIAPTGTTSAAARAATSRPIRPTRTSSTPAPMAARSRATIAAPAKSRRSIPGRSIPSDGHPPTSNTASSGPSPSSFRRTIQRRSTIAGEVLFKTTDSGMHWTIISPDLTRNDKSKQAASGGPITKDNTGVEVYDTIFSVVESPVQKDLIWAGTDDGLIHLTRDGGQHWENVTPKAMPEWGTVSMIEASPRDAGTVYVAVERHKSDDFAPYIFKTTDFGKTWTKLTSGIPANDYVHAVRIDPRRPGLLFAGTEQGVYVSFDDGARLEVAATESAHLASQRSGRQEHRQK